MLTADMKTAIKTTVAELLPVLVARSAELDFTPGERTNDGEGKILPKKCLDSLQ